MFRTGADYLKTKVNAQEQDDDKVRDQRWADAAETIVTRSVVRRNGAMWVRFGQTLELRGGIRTPFFIIVENTT